MPPKKRTITEGFKDVSPHELETSLGDLHAMIGQWIAKYGHNARLDWDAHFYYDYDPNPSPRFNILRDREETDAEFAERVAKEKAEKEAREAGERAEFERLQAKFGKK